jgi:hypothetical protein
MYKEGNDLSIYSIVKTSLNKVFKFVLENPKRMPRVKYAKRTIAGKLSVMANLWFIEDI